MVKKINLTKGYTCVVDDEDYEYLNRWRWKATEQSPGKIYATRTSSLDGKFITIKMHRKILETTSGLEVDHINGDSLDNRKDNLRPASHQQNSFNTKIFSTNKSGYKGVSFHSQTQKWRAAIVKDYKQKHLGLFNSVIEAAQAYDNAARELFGDFANLNFPGLER